MRFTLPKPLHGWRAFAGEVGIVVLGVVIALAANAFVDELQWRQKVSHAEAAMRLELGVDDGPQAYGRLAVANCLDQRIGRIFQGAGHAPTDELRGWINDYAPPVRTWDTEAWKAVLASDIGSHMGAERLIDWSAPYRLVPWISERNQYEGQVVTQLHAALPALGEASPSERQAVRQYAADLSVTNAKMLTGSKLLLGRIKRVGVQIPQPTERDLLATARRMYGPCVQDPDAVAQSAQSLMPDLRNNSWDSLVSAPGQ